MVLNTQNILWFHTVSDKVLLQPFSSGFNNVCSCICAFGQNGYTALLKASKDGHADVVKLLLAAGANVHRRDKVSFCEGRYWLHFGRWLFQLKVNILKYRTKINV
jgi:hypothetical protein